MEKSHLCSSAAHGQTQKPKVSTMQSVLLLTGGVVCNHPCFSPLLLEKQKAKYATHFLDQTPSTE